MSTITPDQRRPSLFGPIVLIAVGLFFLFGQLNPITNLHWRDVLRLWPLFLIFLGLNIVVQQAPRPLGTVLSGVVALLAVGVFGYTLLAGFPGTVSGLVNRGAWQIEEISFSAGGVTSATLNLEIGSPGANLYALEDSRDLIAGTVMSRNGVQFDKASGNGQATVTLAPRDAEFWMWAPQWWGDRDDETRWNLGLNPDVPMSLSITAAAGSSDLDFRGLMVRDLSLNVSAGDASVFLPDGDYDARVETNAGATTITLPATGEQTVELSVNAGSVTVNLPRGMEARVQVEDQAVGGFEEQNSALHRVGTSNIWQTGGYEDGPDRVTLVLHIAVGSVTIP